MRRVRDVETQILEAQQRCELEGVSFLGGEPFEQAEPLADLAERVQRSGLSVMIFSGYRLQEIQDRCERDVRRLLAASDILVDGRYDASRPDNDRRWVGSTNQQIHFFTSRYHSEDACWRENNTLEIRWCSGELTVNGFPAQAARHLWKKVARP